MNLIALGIALIGIVVVLVGFYIARRLTNKIGAGAAQIGSVVLGLFAVVAFPVDVETSGQAGTYWFFGLIFCAIIGKLFSKRKATGAENA